jgi:hypothetical protein
MLDATDSQPKKKRQKKPSHKPPFEEDDLAKLKASTTLSTTNPLTLLWNVWFHITLYVCRRGRQGQRQLSVTSFKFEKDPSGREYPTMAHVEVSKTTSWWTPRRLKL